jgi:ribosomal protein S18 acetylase RimI-like enzyme
VLTYRDIDPERDSDIECLVRWGNDLSIRHLFQAFASEEQSRERLGLDLPRMRSMLKKSLARGKRLLLVELEGLLKLENFAKTLGAKHAQIGVFEFNTRARRLYESLGYQQLTTIPDITWWKGKHWKDIRMGKPL